MQIQRLTGKKLYLLLHVAVWVILFIVPSYLLYIESSDDWNEVLLSSTQIILYAIIFYFNYLWLVPKTFFNRKRILYFFSAVFVVVCMTAIMQVTHNTLHPQPDKDKWFERLSPFPQHNPQTTFQPGHWEERPPLEKAWKRPPRPAKDWPIYNFLLISILITGFSIGLRYADKVIYKEKLQKEADKVKLNTELAFLKNQISPHFFFNTLNNIYSLVQINVQDGQKAILQLSKLMRYMLYETEKGNTQLSQEIDFMGNYIELMKLRLSDKVSLSVMFPQEYFDITIPPLIFLPFIENAFKHGITYRNPSFIKILLDATPEHIIFECSNSIGSKGEDLFRSGAGIGLENVKKRLGLLFPDMHQLQISSSEKSFDVSLHIDISQREKA